MSRRRKGGDTVGDRTLECYKQVLDSMVNFLGASGTLLRQRIEAGQFASSVDCEVECVQCIPEEKIKCSECSKSDSANPEENVPSKAAPKECAAVKGLSNAGAKAPSDHNTSPNTDIDTSTSNVQEGNIDGSDEPNSDIVNDDKIPPEKIGDDQLTKSPDGNEGIVCICAQVRKIKATSKVASPSSTDAQAPTVQTSDEIVGCRGNRQAGETLLCACHLGEKKDQDDLQGIISERLSEVKKLVELVQIDLSYLKGTSKSAALYQEIMKERAPLPEPLDTQHSRRLQEDISISATPMPPPRPAVRRRLYDNSYGTPAFGAIAAPVPGSSNVPLLDLSGSSEPGSANTPLRAAEEKAGRRIPVSTSPPFREWANDITPIPVNSWTQFIRCVFQKKTQSPGPSSHIDSQHLSQSARKYRLTPLVASTSSPRDLSQRPVVPTICTRADADFRTTYEQLQRLAASRRNEEVHQYSQAQAQYSRLADANPMHVSGGGSASNRTYVNSGNRQGARANFIMTPNILGNSSSSGYINERTDEKSYGNQFCSGADSCGNLCSPEFSDQIEQVMDDSESDYGVSYHN